MRQATDGLASSSSVLLFPILYIYFSSLCEMCNKSPQMLRHGQVSELGLASLLSSSFKKKFSFLRSVATSFASHSAITSMGSDRKIGSQFCFSLCFYDAVNGVGIEPKREKVIGFRVLLFFFLSVLKSSF